jgi:hypothetical protein
MKHFDIMFGTAGGITTFIVSHFDKVSAGHHLWFDGGHSDSAFAPRMDPPQRSAGGMIDSVPVSGT